MCTLTLEGLPSFHSCNYGELVIYRPEESTLAGMAGVELHNFNIKCMQLWNAGYDACLTAECLAGKATINLQLTLGDIPPPPPRACQVRPQP